MALTYADLKGLDRYSVSHMIFFSISGIGSREFLGLMTVRRSLVVGHSTPKCMKMFSSFETHLNIKDNLIVSIDLNDITR